MKKSIKIILIVVCAALLAAGISCGIFALNSKKSKENLYIAFYDVPKTAEDAIQSQILATGIPNINFANVSLEELENKKFTKHYDVLFTWEGILTEEKEKAAKAIPESILQGLPSAIRQEKTKTLPVLLDHYEIAYQTIVLRETEIKEIPATFYDFEAYLELISKKVFSPFFCEGSNNKVLLAFISSVTEALGGAPAVKNLNAALASAENLESVLDVKLGTTPKNEELTLRFIFSLLKTWPKKGFTHPIWYKATRADVMAFMQDKQIGVLFDPLSFHRTVPYRTICDYFSTKMPPAEYTDNHGVIAPAIVGMSFGKTNRTNKIFSALISEEGQQALSNASELAPAGLRGGAYDKQADDVRFFAASCAGGPLQPAYLAAFANSQERENSFCEQIRTYLSIPE